MKKTDEVKRQSLESLHKILKPGDTVSTILRHVSRSGMQREISLYATQGDQNICLDWYASNVLGNRRGKHDGLVIGGAGMDMGFALVYELSYQMFPTGFDCIGDKCPGNDHFNRVKAKHHKDGGYALKQRWM